MARMKLAFAVVLLFVSGVLSADYVTLYRTFESSRQHVGVEVSTQSGRYYCVHNRGTSNNKMGTDASGPSSSPGQCGATKYNIWRRAKYSRTIGQLVAAGGSGYSLTSNNCYNARNRILFSLTGT